MARQRFGTEQIIRKLWEAGKKLAERMAVPRECRICGEDGQVAGSTSQVESLALVSPVDTGRFRDSRRPDYSGVVCKSRLSGNLRINVGRLETSDPVAVEHRSAARPIELRAT